MNVTTIVTSELAAVYTKTVLYQGLSALNSSNSRSMELVLYEPAMKVTGFVDVMGSVLYGACLLVFAYHLLLIIVNDIKELVYEEEVSENVEEAEMVYLDECMMFFESTCLKYEHIDESPIDIEASVFVIEQLLKKKRDMDLKKQVFLTMRRISSFNKNRRSINILLPGIIAVRAVVGVKTTLLSKTEVMKRLGHTEKKAKKTVKPFEFKAKKDKVPRRPSKEYHRLL